jgi:hypothetical protein
MVMTEGIPPAGAGVGRCFSQLGVVHKTKPVSTATTSRPVEEIVTETAPAPISGTVVKLVPDEQSRVGQWPTVSKLDARPTMTGMPLLSITSVLASGAPANMATAPVQAGRAHFAIQVPIPGPDTAINALPSGGITSASVFGAPAGTPMTLDADATPEQEGVEQRSTG